MNIHFFVAIALTLTTFFASSFGQRLSETDLAAGERAMKAIQPAAIGAYMCFLNDSLLEGRGTGTRG